MPDTMPEITPAEIRAIRERLGLTQIEAGALIGGGPRAFTKYEAGTVKPAAAVVNLMRILDANPSLVPSLKGDKSRPVASGATSPFEVTGENIARLTERTLPQLLRRLLNSEAQANSLPSDGIHVASNIHAPDGGEDGRITWYSGPERTSFLPSQHNQFQLKAGEISPSEAARDVVTPGGAVKDMVRSVIKEGGHYIMLCTHPYVQREIADRKARILGALRKSGLSVPDNKIDFRDADQIADWANRHPSVAMWVREHTEPGSIGPFRSWSHWSGRPEHEQSPWVEDERLPSVRARLREQVMEPRGVVRVVGLSGVGKSRLVLEALGPTEAEEACGLFLSDIIMYATLSEVGSEEINRAVQSLADSGGRAVVVVDDCDPETHQILTGMVLRQSSRLSLITIDHDIPSRTLDENTLKVDKASSAVTEGIINHVTPGLQSEDQRRLARFSQGFPKIATDIGRAWTKDVPIAHATDDLLVDAFVLGRRPQNRELLLKSAALLAAFGLVRVDPPYHSRVREIARLGRSLPPDDLHVGIGDLVDRGIALRLGDFVMLQPRPVAMRLAERQWKEWNAAKWDELLAGDTSTELRAMAARQLALLNPTEISNSIVNHVCRIGGPFDGSDEGSLPDHAEVLSSLAEVVPASVAGQIERGLDGFSNLLDVSGDARRHLVVALEKIAFHPHTFEDGARLLLLLAVAENEHWANKATGQFKALFPVYLGNTAADGDARISVLDEAGDTADPKQRLVVVEALIAGSKTRDFSRVAGAETQGARPAMEPWQPATSKDVSDYIKACVERLCRFALDDDQAGTRARSGLGEALRSLVGSGFIDSVEAVVRQVRPHLGYWPQAIRSLNLVLTYDADSGDSEVVDRVQALVEELQPASLTARIRYLITEMPWDYLRDKDFDSEAQYQRQVKVVRHLAVELLSHPDTLSASLPQITCGEQRMADALGVAIAELASSPRKWLDPIVEAVVGTPKSERNYDLLSGFLLGLSKSHPQVVEEFKRRAAVSSELAPAFPQICSRLGVTSSDIEIAVGALQSGLLPAYRLTRWGYGQALADIPPTAAAHLFDSMLNHSAEAFSVAVDLMGMYVYGASAKLEHLRPQIRKIASNASLWMQTPDQRAYFTQMSDLHFEQIMTWMLGKGRQDPDASATALALGRALCDVDGLGDGLFAKGPILSKLLSGFPEVVWPLVGEAIAANDAQALRLRFILGDTFSVERDREPTILSLPDDALFAWCHARPDYAPAFAATILPVLSSHGAGGPEQSLHPAMIRLLDEFGQREDVRQAVGQNIFTFMWSGSTTTYFARYEEPLSSLLEHPEPRLRRWAKDMIRQLRMAAESARNEDDEWEARWEV